MASDASEAADYLVEIARNYAPSARLDMLYSVIKELTDRYSSLGISKAKEAAE